MEKYTVVIPTKNNVDTLKYTLHTCIKQRYPNFEIIVSDNQSTDGTFAMIQGMNDSRIRYVRTPQPLSMTQNFEFALSHATEGYIMCIGADDGLMPNAIEYVNDIVLKYGTKAVSGQYAHYFWPNLPIEEHGKLLLNGVGVHKSEVILRNSKEWLRKTLAFETALYVCDLPNLYYGFVHKSIIDKSMKDGIYFRSITPDAYAAFATAIHVDQYAYSFRPFCIAGISGKSNGLSQMLDGDIAKKFLADNTHPIHKDFVFSPAFEVIMGEAFYHLKDVFPKECAPFTVDIKKMLETAIKNGNKKNTLQISNSAYKMAQMHNIRLEINELSKIAELRKFINLTFKIISSYLAKPRWILGMTDSEKFGIKNVSDAAIVLDVLSKINEGLHIETTKTKLISRIKNRLFVKP